MLVMISAVNSTRSLDIAKSAQRLIRVMSDSTVHAVRRGLSVIEDKIHTHTPIGLKTQQVEEQSKTIEEKLELHIHRRRLSNKH